MRKMILLAVASFLWKKIQGRMRTKRAVHRS